MTVAGWRGVVAAASLPLRDRDGAPLPQDEIDARVEAFARATLAHGDHLLLHVMDCSKTGLSAPSRACATRLLRENPGAVTVVVNSCQLRCAPRQVKADLETGFFVMVTGSKFAGGPAFSGALLVPPQAVAALAERDEIFWPEGLAEHFALFDWPPVLRDKLAGPFGARCNTGLGLRWEAALAEYEAYCALAPALVERAIEIFNNEARRRIAELPELEIVEDGGAPTLLPIHSRAWRAKGDAEIFLRALRRRGIFLGQSVPIGSREALRLSLSAPQIVDACRRYGEVPSEKLAFARLRGDLDALFDAWCELAPGA